MRKLFKNDELFCATFSLICTILIIFNLDVVYDDLKHPEKSTSPTGSGRMFFLLLYYIDKHVGKTGLYSFFILLAILFTHLFIVSFKDKDE